MASNPHKAELPDMTLMDLVMRGNVSFVRRYFDDSLKGHDITRPQWAHLRAATEQGNLAMARLLVTWGARPTAQECAEFVQARGDKADKDVKLLRLAGLSLSELDLVPSPATQLSRAAAKTDKKNDPAHYDINDIPREWHDMLRAVRAAGAPEAIIAGGALRDLYNGRKVHSVDIFVKATPLMHRSFIKRVVAACPLAITPQRNKKNQEMPTLRISKRLGARDVHQYTYGDPLGNTDSWQIIAGDGATKFNIILLNGELGSGLRDGAKRGGLHIIPPIRQLLERFDIGLCQIAYTGSSIITSEAYDRDAKNRTLTLKRPQDTTLSHLGRVVCKYPDYTPDSTLAKILDTGKLPPRPPTTMQNYSYISPRMFM